MFDKVIAETAEHVKRTMLGEASGHDWWHVYRVWQLAIRIGQDEDVDLTVVQLSALLHDIGDWKFHAGNVDVGPSLARQWLESCGLDEVVIGGVCDVIATTSFKGAGVPDIHISREADVVQDADRLDAIGAVGIARTFAFGG